MEAEIIRQAKEVAVNAVLKAGQIVKEHFDQTAVIHEKGSFGDVVTEGRTSSPVTPRAGSSFCRP